MVFFQWRKRYFRLWTDKTLVYYKERNDKEPLRPPIDLRDCYNAQPDPDQETYKKFGKEKWSCFFRLNTRERTYHFITSSQSDMNAWVQKINELNNNHQVRVDEPGRNYFFLYCRGRLCYYWSKSVKF